MPQYKSANTQAADRLAAVATRHFSDGVTACARTDAYVRTTVFLATVLFLTALSPRFEFLGPRAVIVAIAAVLLSISLYWLLVLPRT